MRILIIKMLHLTSVGKKQRQYCMRMSKHVRDEEGERVDYFDCNSYAMWIINWWNFFLIRFKRSIWLWYYFAHIIRFSDDIFGILVLFVSLVFKCNSATENVWSVPQWSSMNDGEFRIAYMRHQLICPITPCGCGWSVTLDKLIK